MSVVAATTATLKYDKATGAIGEEVLVELFERVLRQLNEFLAMLGFCAQNADIGAVTRTELPSHIPIVFDFVAGSDRPGASNSALWRFTGLQPRRARF